MMKIAYALALVLLSLSLCQAQSSDRAALVPAEAYMKQLVSMLSALQKNPWLGWKTGTEVVVRYLGNSDPASTSYAYVQPDLVFQVVQADQLAAVTQVVNGKPYRQEHQIKNQGQPELIKPNPNDATMASLEVDGFSLSCLLLEMPPLIVNDGPSFAGSKEWRLASQPMIFLRKEYGTNIWQVASVLVTKKIGGREFQCVKTVDQMSMYDNGVVEVITTQYRSPDVPGHLVEEVKEFYRMERGQRARVPYLIIHQQVAEIKLP